MTSLATSTSGRVLEWLRSSVEIGTLGLLWLVTSLPVITLAFSTSSLFWALRARDRDGADAMFGTFNAGIRATARPAARISLVVVPVLAVQVAAVTSLLAWGTAAATVALGFIGAVSMLWCSLLLTFYATLVGVEPAPLGAVALQSIRIWLKGPWRSLLAVGVGVTCVAVAWTGFLVAALWIASVPAWLVYSRHPLRPDTTKEVQR